LQAAGGILAPAIKAHGTFAAPAEVGVGLPLRVCKRGTLGSTCCLPSELRACVCMFLSEREIDKGCKA